MDLIGLVNSIIEAVINIDTGRKGFAIIGKEREGRISYEKGITDALSIFKEAQITTDPQALILTEYTYLSQEFHLCNENDKDTLNSLTQAIKSFDDAFLSLQVVEKTASYKEAEKTYPNRSIYRIGGFPKDAFHIACLSHKTRLQNILRVPGIDIIEKALLKQRLANLSTAQSGYTKKQKKALAD